MTSWLGGSLSSSPAVNKEQSHQLYHRRKVKLPPAVNKEQSDQPVHRGRRRRRIGDGSAESWVRVANELQIAAAWRERTLNCSGRVQSRSVFLKSAHDDARRGQKKAELSAGRRPRMWVRWAGGRRPASGSDHAAGHWPSGDVAMTSPVTPAAQLGTGPAAATTTSRKL